jgi:hypothetical protein
MAVELSDRIAPFVDSRDMCGKQYLQIALIGGEGK